MADALSYEFNILFYLLKSNCNCKNSVEIKVINYN